MLGLIQRVTEARVVIDGRVQGEIGKGLLVLLGVQQGDTEAEVAKLAHKLLNYRVFADDSVSGDSGKSSQMNLSLLDISGELLIVSQFTLAANTKKGLRPSFSSAAAPDEAEALYNRFVETASQSVKVATGSFGANMQVSLVNDGPVTFMLEA